MYRHWHCCCFLPLPLPVVGALDFQSNYLEPRALSSSYLESMEADPCVYIDKSSVVALQMPLALVWWEECTAPGHQLSNLASHKALGLLKGG